MPDVPKIVPERLKAGARVAAHPDLDVLTAFVEQVLPAAERESVLEHLEKCGDCREVLAVSLPPLEAVVESETEREGAVAAAASARKHEKILRGWPTLSWAALAAGFVFAVALLGPRYWNRNQSMMARQTTQDNAPAAKPNAPQEQIASKSDSNLALTAEKKAPEASMPEEGRKQVASAELKAGSSATALSNAKAKSLDAKSLDKDLRSRADAGTGMSAGAGASTMAASVPPQTAPARSRSETVQVEGAATSVHAKEADALTASNEMSPGISRAKTPVSYGNESAKAQNSARSELARAQPAAAAGHLQVVQPPGQWAVVGGALLRSVDSGKSWQTMLHADQLLTCFAASRNRIWAGGKAGSVFYSEDSGATWRQIRPVSGNQSLAADVSHIEISGPLGIAILAGGNETWTTTDEGKTWTKK